MKLLSAEDLLAPTLDVMRFLAETHSCPVTAGAAKVRSGEQTPARHLCMTAKQSGCACLQVLCQAALQLLHDTQAKPLHKKGLDYRVMKFLEVCCWTVRALSLLLDECQRFHICVPQNMSLHKSPEGT